MLTTEVTNIDNKSNLRMLATEVTNIYNKSN